MFAKVPADISGAITDAVAEVGDRRPEGTRLTTVAATGKHIRVQLVTFGYFASYLLKELDKKTMICKK
jgi:hypothetical protein